MKLWLTPLFSKYQYSIANLEISAVNITEFHRKRYEIHTFIHKFMKENGYELISDSTYKHNTGALAILLLSKKLKKDEDACRGTIQLRFTDEVLFGIFSMTYYMKDKVG